MAAYMPTSQQIENSTHNLVLDGYTQTVKVSLKLVTMRAHPCLVLLTWYQISLRSNYII